MRQARAAVIHETLSAKSAKRSLAHLLAAAGRLGADEVAILELVADRLLLGHRRVRNEIATTVPADLRFTLDDFSAERAFLVRAGLNLRRFDFRDVWSCNKCGDHANEWTQDH